MYGLAAVPIVTPLSNATVVAPPSSTAYSEIKQGGQRGLQSQQFAQHIQQAQHVQHAQAQYTQRTQYEQHAQRAKRDRIQACMKTIIKCMRCVAKLDPAREMPPAVDRAIMRHVVKHVEQLQVRLRKAVDTIAT
jgi:hypothetical protein